MAYSATLQQLLLQCRYKILESIFSEFDHQALHPPSAEERGQLYALQQEREVEVGGWYLPAIFGRAALFLTRGRHLFHCVCCAPGSYSYTFGTAGEGGAVEVFEREWIQGHGCQRPRGCVFLDEIIRSTCVRTHAYKRSTLVRCRSDGAALRSSI